MKDQFSPIVSYALEVITGDNGIKDNLRFVGLIGSLNSGEAVVGWSDIDLLLILDSDRDGNLPLDLISRLKAVYGQIHQKYPDATVSLLSHSLYDLKNYICFEYLINYSYADCLFTKTDKEFLRNEINEILSDRKVSGEVMKRYSIYHLRHLRFNLIRKYICWSEGNKKLGKLVIDNLLEAAIFVTSFEGNVIKGKRETIEEANRIIDSEEITELLNQAYKLRSEWGVIEEEKISNYLPLGLKCLDNILEIMNARYFKPTPEELINNCKSEE